MLDHLQAAENIAFGVGNGLALLGTQGLGDPFGVFANQGLQLEHDAHPRTQRRQTPGLERTLRGSNRGIDFIGRGEGHTRQHLLGGRVDDVAPFLSGRCDPLAIDQQFHIVELAGIRLNGHIHG